MCVCVCVDPVVNFTSPELPDWLEWENGAILRGTPSAADTSCAVTLVAMYTHGEISYQLEMTIQINIAAAADIIVEEM
jgi:hypothetical protein